MRAFIVSKQFFFSFHHSTLFIWFLIHKQAFLIFFFYYFSFNFNSILAHFCHYTIPSIQYYYYFFGFVFLYCERANYINRVQSQNEKKKHKKDFRYDQKSKLKWKEHAIVIWIKRKQNIKKKNKQIIIIINERKKIYKINNEKKTKKKQNIMNAN